MKASLVSVNALAKLPQAATATTTKTTTTTVLENSHSRSRSHSQSHYFKARRRYRARQLSSWSGSVCSSLACVLSFNFMQSRRLFRHPQVCSQSTSEIFAIITEP